MKSEAKSVIIILFTLGAFFNLSPFFIEITSCRKRFDDINLEYTDNSNIYRGNLKVSIVSERIHIDNNWTAAKLAGICTGNGTFTDPYVILNLDIDALYLDNCIKIENSDSYFRIENCSLSNSKDEYGYAGIYIENCQNGVLNNNYCTNSRIGIRLLEHCSNFSIINNECSYNEDWGIDLYECSNISVIGNECYNNAEGIWLYGDHNRITNNVCYNNVFGMNLLGSNNKIIGNVCSFNRYYGIILRGGSDNYVSQNECFYAEWGLYIFGLQHSPASNYSIIDNKCRLNQIAIGMECVINSRILNNDVENSVIHGIILVNSSRNSISGNFVDVYGQYGIGLDADSYRNDIYLNCITSPLSAYDHGSNNRWDNGNRGNFWSNYTGSDENNDGIGDVPNNISGSAGSQDRFPLMECSLTLKETEEIPIGLIITILSISGGAIIILALVLLDRRKRRKR